MSKRLLACSIMMFFAIALLTFGCATKEPKPAEEVTQPPKAAPAEPGQEMKQAEPSPLGAAGQTGVTPDTGFDKKIYFDFDKFDLSSESMETLSGLAALLKSSPEIKVRIEGNCDERGTIEYNLALGERRAKAAMDYLISQGIDASRLTTVSYGKEKPADPGQNEEAWAKNRRDEFILTK